MWQVEVIRVHSRSNLSIFNTFLISHILSEKERYIYCRQNILPFYLNYSYICINVVTALKVEQILIKNVQN